MKQIKAVVVTVLTLLGLWILVFGYHALLEYSDAGGFIGVLATILSFSWVPGVGDLGFSLIPLIAVGGIGYYLIGIINRQYSKKWIMYLLTILIILFFAYEGYYNLFINSQLVGYDVYFSRLGYIQLVVVLSGLVALYNIRELEV